MSENNKHSSNGLRCAGKALRSAIQSLEPLLGQASIDIMIDDHDKQGLRLTDDCTEYSVIQIQSKFQELFGSEVGELLSGRINTALLNK